MSANAMSADGTAAWRVSLCQLARPCTKGTAGMAKHSRGVVSQPAPRLAAVQIRGAREWSGRGQSQQDVLRMKRAGSQAVRCSCHSVTSPLACPTASMVPCRLQGLGQLTDIPSGGGPKRACWHAAAAVTRCRITCADRTQGPACGFLVCKVLLLDWYRALVHECPCGALSETTPSGTVQEMGTVRQQATALMMLLGLHPGC